MDEKPKILIVEDDLDLSDMLGAYFRVQNYEVRTAAWGQEAIKISREEDLSLIMLDIRLPDINGYEVCRQLRQNRRTQDLPIIFLTEKRDRVDKLQGLELGVVDYIIGAGVFISVFAPIKPLVDFFTFFATTSMAKVMVFFLIVVFLQFRPAGLFPQKGRTVDA